jgi:hypothetical protein
MKAASRAGRRPSSFATLSPYDDDCLTVIIETAKGSPNKCAYTPRLGDFVLTGVLPAGAVCPYDFDRFNETPARSYPPDHHTVQC